MKNPKNNTCLSVVYVVIHFCGLMLDDGFDLDAVLANDEVQWNLDVKWPHFIVEV